MLDRWVVAGAPAQALAGIGWECAMNFPGIGRSCVGYCDNSYQLSYDANYKNIAGKAVKELLIMITF
jgi:hypothetical protein